MGLWQLFCLLSLVLTIVALFQIFNNLKVDFSCKIAWALFVIIVPLIGSISFFIWKKKKLIGHKRLD